MIEHILEILAKSAYFYQKDCLMITYQVQIPESNQAAFINIIESLQSLGVISSFSVADSFTRPGEAIPIEGLLSMLERAEQQAEDGTVIPGDQVIEFMKSWREKR